MRSDLEQNLRRQLQTKQERKQYEKRSKDSSLPKNLKKEAAEMGKEAKKNLRRIAKYIDQLSGENNWFYKASASVYGTLRKTDKSYTVELPNGLSLLLSLTNPCMEKYMGSLVNAIVKVDGYPVATKSSLNKITSIRAVMIHSALELKPSTISIAGVVSPHKGQGFYQVDVFRNNRPGIPVKKANKRSYVIRYDFDGLPGDKKTFVALTGIIDPKGHIIGIKVEQLTKWIPPSVRPARKKQAKPAAKKKYVPKYKTASLGGKTSVKVGSIGGSRW